ncbi:hypothetical protein BD410DRAFT_823733 [Rickenella mellea]|uniref:Uncharacterized protein n=1 Tax=Rickenella mellea TaxID=50990 RepID=A0A4R5XEV5_9AGAM|nr:hypothetical protein BD410DRAFT_823733 [Rickenella mellea]
MDLHDEAREAERAKKRAEYKLTNFLNNSTRSLSKSKSTQVKSEEPVRKSPSPVQPIPSRFPNTKQVKSAGTPNIPRPTYTHKTVLSVPVALPKPIDPSSSPPKSSVRTQRPHALSFSSRTIATTTFPSRPTPSSPQRTEPRPATSPKRSDSPRAISPKSPVDRKPVETLVSQMTEHTPRPRTPSIRQKILAITLPSPSPRKSTVRSESTKVRPTHTSPSSPRSEHTRPLSPRKPHDAREARDMSSHSGKSAPQVQRPRSPPSAPSAPSRREGEPVTTITKHKSSMSRLDFWRAPRFFSASNSNGHGKSAYESILEKTYNESGDDSGPRPGVLSPQTQRVTKFVPMVPKEQRLAATSARERKIQGKTPRLDSFLSDSMPMPQPHFTTKSNAPGPSRSPRERVKLQHVAETRTGTSAMRRSNSSPGQTRPLANAIGRVSPCLRIGSPKFLTRDQPGRITPERVGSPKLRGRDDEKVLQASKKVRRTTHGSFDFERPGSRTSSKSGYSESKSAKSDGTEKEGEQPPATKATVTSTGRKALAKAHSLRVLTMGSRRSEALDMTGGTRVKPPDPIPPLPPAPKRVSRQIVETPMSHFHSPPTPQEDGTTLPKLSSRKTHRTYPEHPAFKFESLAPPPSRGIKDYYDREAMNSCYAPKKQPSLELGIGLAWAPTKLKENAMVGSSVNLRSRSRPGSSDGHGAISGRPSTSDGHQARGKMEESEVVKAFKDVLGDAGYVTFKKYIHRYDAHIIPLDGPSGLTVRTRRLLDLYAPTLSERHKRELLENFVNIIRTI